MKTLTCGIMDAIPNEYPPTCIIADIWDGLVTLLAIDHPDEDIAQLRKAAREIQEGRRRRNKREVDRKARKRTIDR